MPDIETNAQTHTETEDETIARIETALQKIAAAGKPGQPARAGLDHAALTKSLDGIIGRLRQGLEPPAAPDAPAAATATE